MRPLELIREWPVRSAAAATVSSTGSVDTFGELDHRFEVASITKLMTALAVLVAVEEGSVGLDDMVTDAGATVADLLCHAGGMAPESADQLARPRTRRIYSTAAYDRLGEVVAERTGIGFADYLTEAVFVPLGMEASALNGSPGSDAVSTVRDLISLGTAWRESVLVHRTTLAVAVSPVLPHLGGVVPGFGRYEANHWGLGPEIKGSKDPHWTGALNSGATFGHFGRAGGMMWVDPEPGTTLIALSNEPFGPWAVQRWPVLSDAMLRAG